MANKNMVTYLSILKNEWQRIGRHPFTVFSKRIRQLKLLKVVDATSSSVQHHFAGERAQGPRLSDGIWIRTIVIQRATCTSMQKTAGEMKMLATPSIQREQLALMMSVKAFQTLNSTMEIGRASCRERCSS